MSKKNSIILAIIAVAAVTTIGESLFAVSGMSAGSSINPANFTRADDSLFNPNVYYRLTSVWQGECKSLDVVNDGKNNRPILSKSGHVSGQYWKITPAGNGYYRLTTLGQGDDKSLDISNDGDRNQPILANTGDYKGQLWKITPLDNNYFRLTTKWQGDGKSLDIVNDGNNNQPILAATSEAMGQYWKISKAEFVSKPPASLKLDPFYKKYLNADGIPVISSEKVPDAALYQVRFMALQMLSKIPNVLAEMKKRGARIAVMAKTEVTTDIPEHAYLKDDPKEDYNKRARGLGGSVQVPTSSCAEENVLCYEQDGYRGEDIFIHEFAHSIHDLGLVFAYPDFQKELDAAYDRAKSKKLWANTYAMENAHEYFAEGVQSWFNANLEADPPNGIHNHVNTREELKAYDIALYNLLKKYFPEDENRCTCN